MIKKKISEKRIKPQSVGIILEGISSDFKLFGETLLAVKEKGEATFDIACEIRRILRR